MLEMVLVYYLYETGAMMINMEQLSGWGEMRVIHVWGQEVVDYLVEDWKNLLCLRIEEKLE